MAEVSFDPAITVEECRLAGRQFGGAQAGGTRVVFERALVLRLSSLSEVFGMVKEDCDEAIAAFDQAAWTAWEAGAKRQEQHIYDASSSVSFADKGNTKKMPVFLSQ